MASMCSVCPKEEKKSTPSSWCPDCNDLLCKSCTRHHSRSSATRNHKVIPYENYQKLPQFILNIRSYCTKHSQKYSEFCRHHDTPICIICLKKDHTRCEDIPKIEDIVQKVKYSVLFEDTMLEMETKCGTLKQIADDRNKNLKELNKTHKKMKAGFEKTIDSWIKDLTNLKDKTLYKMDTMYNELDNDISKTIKSVQSKEMELRAILDQKEDILKYASNVQTFIGMKEIENLVNEVDMKLNELTNDEKLMEYNLQFKVNETMKDIISGIQSLGDIQITKSPSVIPIQNTGARYLEAVKVVQTPAPVKLHLQKKIELDDDHTYHGYCTLPSGLMVIADHGDFDGNDCMILLHNSNGSLRSTIKFYKSDGVCDVSAVDDYHVTVSHPGSGIISIIDVNNCFINEGKEVLIKTLNIEGVRGLCCIGRDIVCCVEEKGLVRVNIDNGQVETVVKDESVSYDSQVEVRSSLICYTCPDEHKVTILDTQYNVLFTYKDKAVLWYPTGVATDDHSNIFVTGYKSDILVLISPDGKSCHQLLGKDDGLCDPSAVHYDSSGKKLVVVNNSGPAFVYSVE